MKSRLEEDLLFLAMVGAMAGVVVVLGFLEDRLVLGGEKKEKHMAGDNGEEEEEESKSESGTDR